MLASPLTCALNLEPVLWQRLCLLVDPSLPQHHLQISNAPLYPLGDHEAFESSTAGAHQLRQYLSGIQNHVLYPWMIRIPTSFSDWYPGVHTIQSPLSWSLGEMPQRPSPGGVFGLCCGVYRNYYTKYLHLHRETEREKEGGKKNETSTRGKFVNTDL